MSMIACNHTNSDKKEVSQMASERKCGEAVGRLHENCRKSIVCIKPSV